MTLGKDSVIVKKYTEDKFEEQSNQQCMQGALNSAKSQAQETVSNVKGKAQDSMNGVQNKANDPQTKDKISSTLEDVKTKSQGLLDKTQSLIKDKVNTSKDKIYDAKIKSSLGQYLTKNIIGNNDEVIASKGTMINHEIIDKANQNGMLEQIFANTTPQSSAEVAGNAV